LKTRRNKHPENGIWYGLETEQAFASKSREIRRNLPAGLGKCLTRVHGSESEIHVDGKKGEADEQSVLTSGKEEAE